MNKSRLVFPAGLVPLALLFLLFALCLSFPKEVALGMQEGLLLLSTQLIPALFPFLVVSHLAAGPLFLPLFERLFGWIGRLLALPKVAGGIFVISLLGGYPVGGILVSQAIKQHRLTPKEGSRLLLSVANGAPSFLVGFVGGKLTGNYLFGWCLVGLQALLALLIGLLFRPIGTASSGECVSPSPKQQESRTLGVLATGWTEAVAQAAKGMLTISGFVLFACALAKPFTLLLPARLSALLSVFVEISGGLPLLLSQFPLRGIGSFLLGFSLGFGGLSVMGQVISSLFANSHFLCSPRLFLLTRPLLGLLFGLACFGLFSLFPIQVSSVFAPNSSPAPTLFSASPVGVVLLLILCGMLLAGSGGESKEKNLR